MTREQLQERTMDFAVRVIAMVEALPKGQAARIVTNQASRSSTSVASNYRAANCAKSRDDFACKLNVCLEEADEPAFWIELAMRTKLLSPQRLKPLHQEAEELTKIFNAALSTTRRSQNRKS
jgi:four helix bundle protein